jgi:acyl-coenzyme A thioesterase 9
MEDLDSLAGSISYRHVLPDNASISDARAAGIYLVTAAIERLDMLRPLSATQPENLRLSGHISYTSRSSMEVLVKLESVSRARGLQDNPEAILVGRFTMACRDAKTGKAHPIPQLIVRRLSLCKAAALLT